MEVFDLYNLEPHEIEMLIQRSTEDAGFKEKLVNDVHRLNFNLASLLQSFPKSAEIKRQELKETIGNLKILLTKLA